MQLALWNDASEDDPSGLHALPRRQDWEGRHRTAKGGKAPVRVLAPDEPHDALVTVDNLEAEAHRYEEKAHADSTRKAYQTDWNAFERWCEQRHVRARPATPDTLALYLTHLAKLGRKASTIRRARIAVGLAHAHDGLPRPDQHARIRMLERGIGRVHGTKEKGADPLLAEDVAKLVAALPKSLRDDRDRALILLGFAGAFRAAELVGLNIEDLSFDSQGLDVFLARSKEDPLGKGTTVRILRGEGERTCPVEAVGNWVRCVGRPCGPLFRDVRGPNVEHARLHPRAVTRAVQRACERAGLEGTYSAHSLRSGLATSAFAAGASERHIQLHGRWKDRRSLDRYIQIERTERLHPANRLL